MTQSESPAPATAKVVRKARRSQIGVVASDVNDKTIKVMVERRVQHPKYEKRVRRTEVYMAHDEHNEAKVGDIVLIIATRRLSKTKSWRFKKIIRPAVVRG